MSVAAQTKTGREVRIRPAGWRGLAGVVLAMILVGGGIYLTAWRRLAFIDLGYEIRSLEKRESELRSLTGELEIEKAMLSSPERIEKLAREKLGLMEPVPGQVQIVK